MTYDVELCVTTAGLADQTIRTLRAHFDTLKHSPSEDHWAALTDVASTLEAMANAECPPLGVLSAVDPGVGKTQTVLHFVRALLSSADHHGVGMLIGVGRINEAKALAAALSDCREHVALLTSDDEANAMSGTPAACARLLITTQQRIELLTEGRSFAAAEAFHYRGHARDIRVWDETWLPGAVVTLSRDALLALVKPARTVSPELADTLDDFATSLRRVADGEAVDVPDLAAIRNGALYDLLASLGRSSGRQNNDDHQAMAAHLTFISGQTVRAHVDGKTGISLLTYRHTLPTDLPPILVLDASGRVRHTYADIETYRGNVKRLKAAVKDYSPLTVHVWRTAGSKSGFQMNGDKLAKGIAETILTRPRQRWLVVAHKSGSQVGDVEKGIRRHLNSNVGDNVSVITWGHHMATNDYADVPNVILAGTLFMRDSASTSP
jgi:hypothetical protein